MKQIFQDLKSGETRVEEVLSSQAAKGQLLISTRKSLVSVGTERMLVDFGKANLIEKALQQPDKVKQALEKIGTDGLMPTVEAIRSKLDQPMPLGYSNVGVVADCGGTAFSVGDRVVSNGHHAEVVRVPKNLCALIPAEVDDESAAFTVLGVHCAARYPPGPAHLGRGGGCHGAWAYWFINRAVVCVRKVAGCWASTLMLPSVTWRGLLGPRW